MKYFSESKITFSRKGLIHFDCPNLLKWQSIIFEQKSYPRSQLSQN